MTRALVLSWEYPPVVEGGLARHVHQLAVHLAAGGTNVHVLTRGPAEAPAREPLRGVGVHRVRTPPRPDDLDAFLLWVERLNDALLAAGLRLAERIGFDVVHGHDWLVAAAAEALARRLDVPFVVTTHATEHGRHQGFVDAYPQSRIHAAERTMVHAADLVLTCSAFMRDHVAEVFELDPGAIAVVANGVDGAALGSPSDLAAVRARFVAPDERLVLLAGRLVYEKGFQLALEALPGLIERAGPLRFVVAGSGTHELELRDQASALGLLEHGVFLGWVGDGLLGSLYRAADLCVVPSIYEPFGLVALEAMAAGCPCLVADTGGLREVVPSDAVGLRFRSGDVAALTAGAERLLTAPELRARLAVDGARHARSFRWAQAADEVAALYAGVAARSRRAA